MSLCSVLCVLSVLCPLHACNCRSVRSGRWDLAQAPLAGPSLQPMLCRGLKIWRGQSRREGLDRLFCVLWPHTAVLCLNSPPLQGLSSSFVGGCSCSGSVECQGWVTLSFQMC